MPIISIPGVLFIACLNNPCTSYRLTLENPWLCFTIKVSAYLLHSVPPVSFYVNVYNKVLKSVIPLLAKLNTFSHISRICHHSPITLLAYLRRAIHRCPAIFMCEGLSSDPQTGHMDIIMVDHMFRPARYVLSFGLVENTPDSVKPLINQQNNK